MHRRTLNLYSHLLIRQNATSVTGGRYGRTAGVLRESVPDEAKRRCGLTTSCTNSFYAKTPAIAVKIKTKESLVSSKDSLLVELSEEIPTEEPSKNSSVKENSKSLLFPRPSVGNIRSGNKWDTEPFPALLESNIFRAKSTSELLELSDSSTLILKHACIILSRLSQLSLRDSTISFDSLTMDKRFMRICNLIQRGNYSQSPQSLFLAIHGLQNLGVTMTSDIFKTLSGELKWAMRRSPVRFLARAIELFSEQDNGENKTPQETKSREEAENILQSAVETLQRRWVEVTSGNDFIAIFKILNFLNAETRGKLEDRAVELVQGFYPQEMRKMFVVLGGQKRRPTPLLRALAFHLSKSEERASAKDLIELTYALNELTFADPVLMERVCNDLCSEICNVESSSLISSLVTSLGQMRYKHKGLLQILDEWIMTHLDNLRPFDCAAWLLSCAVLDYQSSSKEKFCKQARLILFPKSESNQIEWVNIVHALVILNEHSADLIASALKPEIIKKIDDLGVKGSKTKLRLLNINAVAKNKSISGYTGPLLDSKFEKSWSTVHVHASDLKLSTLVLESLGTFLPTGKYLKINQKLESGVFVDAVCFFNDKMDPLPVPSGPPVKNTVSLAILVEGYSSLCRGTKDPTGSSILNRKILEAEGYRVVTVPYTEINATEKLVRRVQYLEQKLKTVSKIDSKEKSTR